MRLSIRQSVQRQQSFAAAKSPDAQTHLERDIAATDRAIDALVYQLYGLTAEEIALVEQAAAPQTAMTVRDYQGREVRLTAERLAHPRAC